MQQQMDDAVQTIRDYVCGEVDCGFSLKIRTTDDGVEPVCSVNSNHAGYKIIETPMELADRATTSLQIKESQERRSPMVRTESHAAIVGEVANRFRLTTPEATVFTAHCGRLGLDPFLGMIAPLTFKDISGGGPRTVIPFPTEKGWAALAQKTEPNEFFGPPSLRPIFGEERDAWGYGDGDIVYEAKGRKRSWPADHEGGAVVTAFTVEQIANAKKRSTPAADDPHHFCRTRATRRWYEQNYPGATLLVQEAAAELPAEVIKVIEVEYSMIDAPASQSPQTGAGAQQPRSLSGRGGGDDVISDSQKSYILKMIRDAWGWNEDDLVREKLDDAPLDALNKRQASDLIDRLKQDVSESDQPRQGQLGD